MLAQGLVRALIGTAIVALALCAVEALWPEQRQPRFRAGALGDLLYLLLDTGVRRLSGLVVFGLALGFIILHVARPSIAAQQPVWLQTVEALVGGELIGYSLHRAFHRVRWLWPFHSIHHSTPILDWVAASRVHPVDNAVHRVLTVLPFFLLGFSPGILAAYAPFLTIYPIVLHANVRWGFGPLRYVIASPAWHRWHHASEQEALDRNFAGLFPWIDLLFHTAYFPTRAPERFGLYQQEEPRGLLRQLVYPFLPRRQAAAEFTPAPLDLPLPIAS